MVSTIVVGKRKPFACGMPGSLISRKRSIPFMLSDPLNWKVILEFINQWRQPIIRILVDEKNFEILKLLPNQ